MMKSTLMFLMNEIWINTCFVNQKTLCFDCLIPYTMIPWNHDHETIFWDDYHTVKISYRYNPNIRSVKLAEKINSNFLLKYYQNYN